jgi:nickel-dependent lactate racemase
MPCNSFIQKGASVTTHELTFRPGVTTQVEIDDANLLFYAAHRGATDVPDQRQVVENALENPIGTEKLADLLQPDNSVVIMVDDITRPTPAAKILPFVLERIHKAGIPEEAVLIFMGLGTHRPMTWQELGIKLGDDVRERYRIINRDHREGPFVYLGQTESGTPIEINQEILDADVKIAIGNVIPHISAGWGGGSKIILPGVCSQKTSDTMHLMACIVQPVLEVLGTRDNKPRAEMDAIAKKVGLDFIVNTVMDEDKNMLGVFAGHFIEAHRAACAMAEKAMIIPIPAQADILIVSANPCHFDYWQGIKPYAYSHRGVKEDGVIIFMLDGTEGLCGDAPSHEETMRKYLPWSFEDQKAAVGRGAVEDLVGLNVPMYHAMVRHRVKSTILVTNHLAQEDIDVLEFDSAPTVQEALERAYEMLGRDARVGIIPFGGETLVRVAPDEEQ